MRVLSKSRYSAALWTLVGLAAAATIAWAVWALLGQPGAEGGRGTFFDLWVYNGALFLTAAACFTRAAISSDLRGAWIAVGLGLAAWTFGDAYWTAALDDLRRAPYPSLADAGYLAALPFLFVGIALLVKQRVGRFSTSNWLDGGIAALAAGAIVSAVVAPALIGLNRGDPAAVATSIAYPVGDVLLFSFAVGAIVVSGLRNSMVLLVVAAGLLVWTGTDTIYLYLLATDGYRGGIFDALWPLGAVLISSGVILSKGRRSRPPRDGHHSSMLVPILAAVTAIGVLTWDHFDTRPELSVVLSAATLLVLTARLVISARDNDTLMTALRAETVTDPLTGMPNRRKLFEDLELLLGDPDENPGDHVFAVFDLNGFKSYNDSFGHPAGDDLLRRLGGMLSLCVASTGTAYRLGGDEFCILCELNGRSPSSVAKVAKQALSESGEGFSITASCGTVELPHETRSSSEALRIADGRMYIEKGSVGAKIEQQTHDVLLGALREREPALGTHMEGVATLAVKTARELSLDSEAIDTIGRAAELHDIGKIAIPDAILSKAGPLDEDEWKLMRLHTLIGERILVAAPALRPVATLVRSSHERWDGAGYPDGLKGIEIPLGSRIILICDAYDAMTTDRPYRRAKTSGQAIEELRRESGRQFDPALVEAFCCVLDDQMDAEPPALFERWIADRI